MLEDGNALVEAGGAFHGAPGVPRSGGVCGCVVGEEAAPSFSVF